MSPPRRPARARLRSWLLARAPGARRAPPAALPGDGERADGARPSLGPAPRVLVVRPDHLGDVVLAGPALARLRALRPAAEVTLLVGPWGAAAAERLPGVDHVATLTFPAFRRGARPGVAARYGPLVAGARRLRAARHDLALILRDDDWWGAWLAALAGIPRRAGHADVDVARFLTDALPAAARPAHVTAAAVALVEAAVGDQTAAHGARGAAGIDPVALPLGWAATAADQAAAAALLAPLGPGAHGPVAIHPGSGSPIKRWRPDDWGRVARALTAPGEAVVLTGGPDERDLTAAVARALGRPALDLAGRTELGALAAVYARCRIVLGPDSGPLHVAVAAGTPTVHLFGPADVGRFGPWGTPARHAALAVDLPCAPCGRLDWPAVADHPCVRLIEPARVVGAARAALAAGGPVAEGARRTL